MGRLALTAICFRVVCQIEARLDSHRGGVHVIIYHFSLPLPLPRLSLYDPGSTSDHPLFEGAQGGLPRLGRRGAALTFGNFSDPHPDHMTFRMSPLAGHVQEEVKLHFLFLAPNQLFSLGIWHLCFATPLPRLGQPILSSFAWIFLPFRLPPVIGDEVPTEPTTGPVEIVSDVED